MNIDVDQQQQQQQTQQLQQQHGVFQQQLQQQLQHQLQQQQLQQQQHQQQQHNQHGQQQQQHSGGMGCIGGPNDTMSLLLSELPEPPIPVSEIGPIPPPPMFSTPSPTMISGRPHGPGVAIELSINGLHNVQSLDLSDYDYDGMKFFTKDFFLNIIFLSLIFLLL